MATEKRLIDANALIATLEKIADEDENTYFHLDEITQEIFDTPTVDAVEVVHGRWEKQQGLYSCSECGKTCPYDVQADTIMYWTCNYCPNCGAKMDGDGNG